MTLLLLSKHEKLPLWEIRAIKTSFTVAAFKPKCACALFEHYNNHNIQLPFLLLHLYVQLKVYTFFLVFIPSA